MIKLPKRIYLTAIKQHWRVSYINVPGRLVLIQLPYQQIVLYGKNYTKRAAMHLISRWLKLKAYNHLNLLLNKLNHHVKVSYKKLIIRSQEWQWGSYSSSKTISLNYKLIFLPPTLVKHVLLHELCHVRHLSHSKKFWDELSKYDKHYKKHKKALNESNHYLPHWAM